MKHIAFLKKCQNHLTLLDSEKCFIIIPTTKRYEESYRKGRVCTFQLVGVGGGPGGGQCCESRIRNFLPDPDPEKIILDGWLRMRNEFDKNLL
jgi:hypothetical protein